MKLKTLEIKYNPMSSMDWEGTPAKSYSAKITLITKLGETTTVLMEEDIIAIMGVVCQRVAENMREIAQTTATDIHAAVSGRLLESDETSSGNEDMVPF